MSIELKADVLLVFDTTGSMYPCAYETKRSINQITKKLFDEASDVRVGVIAHGDYCDAGSTYTLMTQDFTEMCSKLTTFIDSVEPTYGGDFPECYELSWREDAKKLVVMVGDATPHPVHDPQNAMGLDWKQEALDLSNRGIKIYAVHAMPGIRKSSTSFWKSLAHITGGVYLTSDQFSIIPDLIVAATYSQLDFLNTDEKYNFLLSNINSSSYCVVNNIEQLAGYVDTSKTSYNNPEGLTPVPDGKFQVMQVLGDIPIKEFVEDAHLIFKKGKGYYELGRTETVQCYKSIILQEKSSGKLFEGPQVREMLGLRPESPKGSYEPERLRYFHLDNYRVFIQSTSHNRKLREGALFLYEVSESDSPEGVFEVGELPSKKEVKESLKPMVYEIKKPKSTKSILNKVVSELKDTSKGMVDRAKPTATSGDIIPPTLVHPNLTSAEPLPWSPSKEVVDSASATVTIKGKEVTVTSGMAALMSNDKVYLLLVVAGKVFYVDTLAMVKQFNSDEVIMIYKPILRQSETESYLEYDANNFSDGEKMSQVVYLA